MFTRKNTAKKNIFAANGKSWHKRGFEILSFKSHHEKMKKKYFEVYRSRLLNFGRIDRHLDSQLQLASWLFKTWTNIITARGPGRAKKEDHSSYNKDTASQLQSLESLVTDLNSVYTSVGVRTPVCSYSYSSVNIWRTLPGYTWLDGSPQ